MQDTSSTMPSMARRGISSATPSPYDAVVLDIGLPRLDGLSVLEQWRRDGRTMPVLLLTARDRWSDKVQGIDSGADDYVAKPFHIEEVLARVRALVRRAAGHASNTLSCGPVRARPQGKPRHCRRRSGQAHGARIQAARISDAPSGKVISRTELTEHLYDQDFDRDFNTIEVFVGRLRKKLGVDLIETVRGMGYRIGADPLRVRRRAAPKGHVD